MKRLVLCEVVWKASRRRGARPSEGFWAVYYSGYLQSWFNTKPEAVSYARRIAKKRSSEKRGVTLRIKKKNGRVQEERTYPRALDPRRSPG